jgi:predicted metalloprotease
MYDLISEVSDKLMEGIAKSRAVADLLRTVNNRNLADDTLPDIGWLLNDELKKMEEQVNRIPPRTSN